MKYTIQKGDTLSAIAKRHGTTVETLTRMNNIANPDKIYAGRTLAIPATPWNPWEAIKRLLWG